jgi:hypothetical protein
MHQTCPDVSPDGKRLVYSFFDSRLAVLQRCLLNRVA